MRLRNFCLHMGFAVFGAVILIVFARNVPLAILFVIGHLIWALFNDRSTVRGEKRQQTLKEKYPANSIPDTYYVVGEKTVVLKDSFVKNVLINTINPGVYSSGKRKDKKFVEKFYSSVMTGEYTFEQHIVTDQKIVPGNDFPTEYFICSNEICFNIQESAFEKCNIGDLFVVITVKEMPAYSVIVLLDAENEQHLVAAQKPLYQLIMLL